jgi:ATP-dependent DNA ligase
MDIGASGASPSPAAGGSEPPRAASNKAGLEGIVSKLASQPYRSGKNPRRIKVKTAWRGANRDRWEMFEKR